MIATRPTCQVGVEWAEPGIFAQQIYQVANVGRFPYLQRVFEQRDEWLNLILLALGFKFLAEFFAFGGLRDLEQGL